MEETYAWAPITWSNVEHAIIGHLNAPIGNKTLCGKYLCSSLCSRIFNGNYKLIHINYRKCKVCKKMIKNREKQ